MNKSVRGWSVKRFERSYGLDTALYKNVPLHFFHTLMWGVRHLPHMSLICGWSLGHLLWRSHNMCPPLPVPCCHLGLMGVNSCPILWCCRCSSFSSCLSFSRRLLGLFTRPVNIVTWPYNFSSGLLIADRGRVCRPMVCLTILKTSLDRCFCSVKRFIASLLSRR